jgi:hypothetical protein
MFGTGGQLEEAELELLFGESREDCGLRIWDCGLFGMGSGEVIDGVVVFADLPRRSEVAEGSSADLDAEFFAGKFDGVEGGVLLVEVDEVLFLVVGEGG